MSALSALADPATAYGAAEPVDRPPQAPQALLLDFGGVIITTHRRPSGVAELVAHLRDLLRAAGTDLQEGRLEQSLHAGRAALKHWKHASSRRRRPRELTVRELLEDFWFADLPDPARAILVGHGAQLLETMALTLTEHRLRDGVVELLDLADEAGVPVGIVSNAHSGRSHRRLLAELGIEQRFAVQIYSDEAGIRKPHPDMLHRAARALGISVGRSWYVGDTLDRDLVAGRRAGAGAVVLIRSQHTDEPPFPVREVPDAVLDTPRGLIDLMRRALADEAHDGGAAHDGGPAADVLRSRAGAVRPDRATPVRVLLLDHGGVVSATVPADRPLAGVAEAVLRTLGRAGVEITVDEALHLVRTAHGRYKAHKGGAPGAPGETLDEVTPRQYWGEFTRDLVDAQAREALLAEAEELQLALYRSKSRKTLRPGVTTLLERCAATSVPVIVVSNTINGRGVREVFARHGLADRIAGWACSDEVGLKKPHAEIFTVALRMAGVPAEQTAMLGDKPFNDGLGAREVGIGRRILTRGGSGTEDELQDALAEGWATDVVDHPGQVVDLLG